MCIYQFGTFGIEGSGVMGTFITAAVLIAAVGLAVRSMVRDKKKGKSLQCGGDCGSCKGCH